MIKPGVRRTGRLAFVAAVAALLALGTAQSLAAPDTIFKTTVQQRIVPNTDADFRELLLGAGEGYTVRQELGSAGAARAAQRTSLLYFGQLSDFQLADEESPARVEFVDPAGPPVDAAWRPWEAMNPHIDDAMIRQMNSFVPASPVAAGNGARRRMDFSIVTGDSADSQQFNETDWVKTLLEGGTLNPGSGVDPATSSDPLCAFLPALINDAATPANYTGVQDYTDYVEGAVPYFYDPNDPKGLHATFPDYGPMPTSPKIMDTAQLPFTVAGLDVPSYTAIGNHDALVQGNQAANQEFEQVATGCIKPLPTVPPPPGTTYGDALMQLDPTNLLGLAGTERLLVPPDPNRRFVTKQQYKAVFQAGAQGDGHGFDYVDPAQNAASAQSAGYFSWSPAPKFRFIALDTTCDAGVTGPSADGNIDHPQFQWLQAELGKAQAAGQYAVLFSHHAIQSLTCSPPDELAGPCGSNDSHGHPENPGFDIDPRNSAPIHLGADTTAMLRGFPNVIAWVAGHSHVHDVTPIANQKGGGFWMIRTAAEADWPQQSRLLEVFDNGDGTLSIFGTVLDHAGGATAPATLSSFTNPDPDELASIGRTLAYNDFQVGARECTPSCGEGQTNDRNVELLLRNPLPSSGGVSGLSLKKGPCANRKSGTRGRDRLRGTKQGDRLRGKGGRDKVLGLKGRDCLKGERGRDRLKGGRGADSLAGGRGADKLVGGKGRDKLKGGAGSDRLVSRGGGRDKVRCGQGPNDVAVVDRRDRVRGCETLKRPAKRG